MYAGLTQTLTGFKGRPLTQRRSISDVPMDQIHATLTANKSKSTQDIHEETLLYYLHSHGMHLIEGKYDAQEALPDNVAKLLNDGYRNRSEIALRMFSYMLIITGEEAMFGRPRNSGLFDYIESQTQSAEVAEWAKKVMENRSHENYPKSKNITLGQAVAATRLMFECAQWSPGFGGERWADVSRTLEEAVRGRSSLELMVDHAFTLCHNNGAIFNKGHGYSHYHPCFYRILDVQASGQIPTLIHSKNPQVDGITPKVKAAWAGYAELFPDECMAPFDEKKVHSMESVRKKKEESAQKSAKNFFSQASAPQVKGPPPRKSDFIDEAFANSLGVSLKP